MSHKEFIQSLVEILVQQGSLPATAVGGDLLNDFKGESKAEFDDFLLSESLISKADLLLALSKYYQVPPFDAQGYLFDHELLVNFPKAFMLTNCFIPIQIEGNILTVVASEPTDELCAIIGEHESYVVELRVGLQREIIDAIEEFYDPSLTNIEDLTDDDEAELYLDDEYLEELDNLEPEDDIR
ncbi:MAG TPA: hypothetical protein VJJ81_03925 [Candidatus Babeliales bacterium]|nr:hypothetical protein [Candidatus Babeliales bacterium]